MKRPKYGTVGKPITKYLTRPVDVMCLFFDDYLQEINDGEAAVILISPERMANKEFIDERLAPVAGRVALLVIDEAHCISTWGHDFRRDYRRLPDVVDMLNPGTPVLCTTATATDKVVTDITELFGGRWSIQRGSLARESLHLYAFKISTKQARMAWLAHNVPKFPGSGIVYVLTKPDANQVTDWLRSRGIDAKAYYSGVLPSADDDFQQDMDQVEYSKHLENLLLGNKVKLLVATRALGMGFDKPDIGFVIHFQVSVQHCITEQPCLHIYYGAFPRGRVKQCTPSVSQSVSLSGASDFLK